MRYVTTRNVMAVICGGAALLFLAINSTILARGAGRWAESEWDRLSYMAIAGTVPWIIGLMPFLVSFAWRLRQRTWAAVVAAMWVVFVSYNILGAGGAMNFMRTDVLASREHDATAARDLRRERERLVALRDAIPAATRPAALLAPLLKAEEGKREWQWSDGCTEQRAATRRFCAGYAKLASELGAAQELARLNGEIATLDGRSSAQGIAARVVDPAAQFWTAWTGLSEERVSAIIPLATPIVLELGSMFLLSLALMLAGIGHGQALLGALAYEVPRPALPAGVAVQGEAVESDGTPPAISALPPPQPVQPPALQARDPVAAGRQLAEWFFSECTRPVSGGGLTEERWYALYSEHCDRSNDTPIGLEEFRELARKAGAGVVLIDGRWFYQRVLPLVPSQEAI